MATKSAPTKRTVSVPQTALTQAMQASMKSFLVMSILGTVVITLIGSYFIWALAQKNIETANKIKAQDIYMKLAEKKVRDLNDAEVKLADIKKAGSNGVSDYELVTERSLPNSDDIGILLTMFQKLEADTLVKLDDISKQDTSAGTVATTTTPAIVGDSSNAQSFPLTFKATGTYEQIQKFLKKLEVSTRVFDFSNLKISGANGVTSIDMSYKLYYLPKQSISDKQVPIGQYKEGQQ